MRRRPGTYESRILVDLCIWASDFLNEKLGLDKNGNDGFRVNLRFFADYRNTMFVVVVSYLLFKLLWQCRVEVEKV